MLRAGRSRVRAAARLVALELEASRLLNPASLSGHGSFIDNHSVLFDQPRTLISLASFDPTGRTASGPSLPEQATRPATCQYYAKRSDITSPAWEQYIRAHLPNIAALRFGGSYRSYHNVVGESLPDDKPSRLPDGKTSSGKQQQQQQPEAQQSAKPFSSGWTRSEVLNAPNAISLARLLSGPLIASWIIDGNMQAAFVGLAVSGWSDWLDGYVARRFNQQSTIGSYLDPLADKALICCVVAALGIQGTLPGYLAAVIIGRDVFLVAASFAHRARSLGWRRVSLPEFFQVASPERQGQSASANAAPKVQPLYVSKVNTVLQLATVSGFLLHAWAGWPPADVLHGAALVTAGSTIVSGGAYVWEFWNWK